MLETVSFYLFAGVLLFAALLAVTLRHPVYSVLCFLVSMFSLAVLFWLLKAYFVAVVHITVYAGAILILFLFVIMLLGFDKEPPALWTNPIRFGFAIGFSTLSLAGLLWIYKIAVCQAARPEPLSQAGTIESIGRLLFSSYLLPFEFLSVVLLVAIIGSVVLAKKEL
ncbi:MAG: NADH-quinone oxidoreductase subunit J [Candidatus Omnitrophica bacterium]|nr:NADH-quinone oxidoreductase subunit J [Candidatus Omnitrophota bacterium]